jgi:N-acetylmuramic acid 6-phosphate etherase
MVNVQPRNEKLIDRACRIIRAVADVDQEEAVRLLEASGKDVKTAIVMSRLNLGKSAAEDRLRESGGMLRKALGESQSNR